MTLWLLLKREKKTVRKSYHPVALWQSKPEQHMNCWTDAESLNTRCKSSQGQSLSSLSWTWRWMNDWHEWKRMCCGPLWPAHAEFPPKAFSRELRAKFQKDGVRLWDNKSRPQGSILVKLRCGLLNASFFFLQRLDCAWEEAKGVKVRGQDTCGDQVRVQQRVTVQHKDTQLFSLTALGDSSQVSMRKCAGCRKSDMFLAFCSFSVSYFS